MKIQDNPVGTGYSFVEDTSLFAKTDEEAANDLTKLLEKLFNGNAKLQSSPVFIVAESYGGKFAVTLALSALKAIGDGKLKLKLGGHISSLSLSLMTIIVAFQCLMKLLRSSYQEWRWETLGYRRKISWSVL